MDLATLQRGREAFERRAWAESYRLLQAADRDAPLDAEDLERLAIAAYLVGRDDDCEAFTARAHQAFLDHGDREGAARAAFWLGFALMGQCCPGLYFVGLLFLYSLSSALLGGVGRDAKYIVEHIVSTRQPTTA